jgi:hypothetical protein
MVREGKVRQDLSLPRKQSGTNAKAHCRNKSCGFVYTVGFSLQFFPADVRRF